jgi:hypothetical protein
MAAPTPVARVAPVGTKLDDPFPTTMCFGVDPTIGLWEKTIKPPGLDGREPIDTTTMFNQKVVTKAPRVLIDTTNATGKYQYDPACLTPLLTTVLNKRGVITVWFASGASWCFYGYLQKFTPSENSDSTEPPMADIEVVQTNWDPVHNVEALPVYTASSGTGSIT